MKRIVKFCDAFKRIVLANSPIDRRRNCGIDLNGIQESEGFSERTISYFLFRLKEECEHIF